MEAFRRDWCLGSEAFRKEQLARRRKNDPGKLAIAVRLRRETTLSIKAIAARLELGSYNTANARLHRAMKEEFEGTESAQATLGK